MGSIPPTLPGFSSFEVETALLHLEEKRMFACIELFYPHSMWTGFINRPSACVSGLVINY